jgi:uncharacterized FAD-dependent dehydrogenase
MSRTIALRVDPEIGFDAENLQNYLIKSGYLNAQQKKGWQLLKRSIDARGRQVKVQLSIALHDTEIPAHRLNLPKYQRVKNQAEVHIIGAGPAGIFAALKLIELGIKPVLLERGKDVRARRRDLAAINKEHNVNSESNYCFGEGGAGTYSDGKLYTRSNKRGDINGVLETFFAHGAAPEILIDTHPHIGTNKLPGIIAAMRQTILDAGGEVHFETRIDDIEFKSNALSTLITAKGERIPCKALILATGHSARDIYELLHKKAVHLEFKPFAMGVRAEHPQTLIDSIQYHCDTRGAYLPAASYALVEQVHGRGVYSFCMCPGGIIAPCATESNQVVTNGWSPSKRNNPYANSGIVVEVKSEDLTLFAKHGALAGMYYQKAVEESAWEHGGKSQSAPAQRMVDFVNHTISHNLPSSSYMPGIVSANLQDVLPKELGKRLALAFPLFGKKMRGYFTNEAVLHAVESRTSTPVRIPRDVDRLMHPQISGLFPCGEGAGYAGGIVSAAMDGQRCAEKAALFVTHAL